MGDTERAAAGSGLRGRYRSHRAAWIAGFACAGTLVIGLLVTLDRRFDLLPKLPALLSTESAAASPAGNVDLALSGKWYAHVFYNDGMANRLRYDTWEVTLRQTEPVLGFAINPQTGDGPDGRPVTGYRRGEALVLTYGAPLTGGLGYGSYFLTPSRAPGENVASVWVGAAVVHDCDELQRDGSSVICLTQKIDRCDMVLSRNPVPSPEALHLYTHKCQRVVDLQEAHRQFRQPQAQGLNARPITPARR